MSTAILKGVIHGKTIELEQSPGLPEGQPVAVTVRPFEEPHRLLPGEGLRRAAGAWDDNPEGLESFLEWNRQQRKINRREIPE